MTDAQDRPRSEAEEPRVQVGTPALDIAAIFRLVLEHSPLPLAATEGAAHLVRYANPAFCHLVGLGEETVVGQPLPGVLGGIEMADTVALLDRVYRTGGAASVAVFRGGGIHAAVHATYAAWLVPGEHPRPAGLLVHIIDTSDQVLAAVRAAESADELRDVSRRLLQAGLEGELRAEIHLSLIAALRESEEHLHVALEEQERALASEQMARGQAQAALQVRDAFLAIAAHELRAPLTSIKGTAQLALRTLERGPLTAFDIERYLRVIVESSGRQEALLGDLLDVSKMRAEGPTNRLEPMDLGALVRAMVARYEQQVERHAIVFRVPDAPVGVLGDAGRLEQVLGNLLDNAVKYSPDGGDISVHLGLELQGVLLTVHDSGIGLPPGEEERIFEPFRRASNAVAHELPGMGLGLYISRQIVEAHGGTLRAESTGESAGTTLTLWLPALPAADEIRNPVY